MKEDDKGTARTIIICIVIFLSLMGYGLSNDIAALWLPMAFLSTLFLIGLVGCAIDEENRHE